MKREMPCPVRPLDHRAQGVEILLVVEAGPRVLDRLPRDQEAQEYEPPFAQAREVLIGLPERKGTPDERNVSMVEEPFPQVRGAVRDARDLARTGEVGPAEHERAPLLVDEPRPAYRQNDESSV